MLDPILGGGRPLVRQSGHAWEFHHFGELFQEYIGERLPGRTLEAERRVRTLKRAVVIGIGGSGTEVVARVKRSVDRFYAGLGPAKGMIQFLAFDTMPLSLQESEMIRETLRPEDEYQHLGAFSPRDLVSAYRNDPDLRRWWEQEYPAGQARLADGCKAIRPLGRLCLWRWRKQVEATLGSAIDRARNLDERAVRDLQLPELAEQGDLRFYVASGTAGGTGSGMFLDFCYLLYRVARARGIDEPDIRCLLVMPGLHIARAWSRQPSLVPAFQSNAYAFLRELQHFTNHGDEFFASCFNYEELKAAGAEPLPEWRPGKRIYLVDNTVAEKLVFDSLDDLFTVASDALFHLMITPLGAAEDLIGTNFDQILMERHQGRIRGFSSLGVSYVLYPARTVARCALSGYLRDVLEQRLLRRLTDEERESAASRAERELAANPSWLDPAAITHNLLSDLLASLSALRLDSEWLAQQEKVLRGQWTAILDQGERLVSGWQGQSLALLNETFDEEHPSWIDAIESLLTNLVNDCAGSDSLDYVREVLRKLHQLLAASSAPRTPVNLTELESRASAARASVVGGAGKLLKSTNRLRANLLEYLTVRKRLADHAVRERAADLAETHLSRVLQQLDRFVSRCASIRTALDSLADALNDQSDEYDPQMDERLVTATTQFVPPGGIEKAVKDTIAALEPHLGEDARQFLRTPLAPLWSLGAPDPDIQQAACQEALRDLVDTAFKRVSHVLSRRVDEVLADVAGEQGAAVLSNLHELARPLWHPNLVRWAMPAERLPEVLSVAKPDLMPDDLLPQALRGDTKPLDDRKLMLLRTQHAAPIHTLVSVEALRGPYLTWMQDPDKARRLPRHLDTHWNDRGSALEDIYPGLQAAGEGLLYFSLGLFSDWLVTERRVPEAACIKLHEDHGFVYRRGTNQYYAVLLETSRGALRKREEVPLCPSRPKTRAAACRNLDPQGIASGKLYMDQLESKLAPEALEDLVGEYIEHLRRQAQAGRGGLERDQAEAEIQVLTDYLEQGRD